ncbi:coiled-coil domain-containing protein [Micromonospora tarensis]|uniref:Uncharacterized protein n=1 Tax=Micromonospora tarensis TaxID=2806100 RepID=A0ABS1YK83_9ACTN|nr:hypothetical protein [Micromonospora tarensis]MBM0277806.1 hypothetical protein [Micromonospora tarensis]
MARTVKVDLVLENMRYVRGAREAARETKVVTDSVDDLGEASGKASKETDRLGGEMSALAADARRLDRQIDDTTRGIRELAREIAHTSDAAQRAELKKKLVGEQRGLRDQVKLRKLIDLPDLAAMGEDAAEGFGASFVTRIGPILAKAPLGPVGVTLGGIIAVPLAATVGAAVSAGILGGVAGAGIIGGVSLAAKDARVQAAGKQLGAAVMGDLEASATRFVDPTIHGIGIIRSAWADVADDVDGVFAATSRYVEPLARGVGGLIREIGPGLREAAEAAGPVVRELSDGLPRIGSAIDDLLATAADNADEAASAVRLLVMGLEGGITAASSLVDGLGTLYGVLVNVGTASADFAASYTGWIPIVGDKIADNRDRMHELKAALDEGGTAGENAGMKIWGGLDKVEASAAEATVEVETLSEAIRRMAGENITAEQANIRLEEAIDRATAAGKANNDGIDENTAKGRENRQALIGIAEAANASADAILAQTGSQALASAATDRGREKFLAAAGAMGVSRTAARRLADQLFGIPASRSTTVTVNTKQAEAAVSRIKARLSEISRRIGVDVVVNARYASYGGGKGTGSGYSTGQRWGGVTEYAQTGLLRDASIFNPVAAGARYGFAEPATGGEAFIPKYGDTDRSRAIWDYVGRNWLRMPTASVARPAATSGSTINPLDMASAIRSALVGVSVQMDGRTVGYIQGREADLYSR